MSEERGALTEPHLLIAHRSRQTVPSRARSAVRAMPIAPADSRTRDPAPRPGEHSTPLEAGVSGAVREDVTRRRAGAGMGTARRGARGYGGGSPAGCVLDGPCGR